MDINHNERLSIFFSGVLDETLGKKVGEKYREVQELIVVVDDHFLFRDERFVAKLNAWASSELSKYSLSFRQVTFLGMMKRVFLTFRLREC